jgi:hypothetical protein
MRFWYGLYLGLGRVIEYIFFYQKRRGNEGEPPITYESNVLSPGRPIMCNVSSMSDWSNIREHGPYLLPAPSFYRTESLSKHFAFDGR